MSLQIRTVVSQPFGENTYLVWLAERDEALVVDPGFEPELIFDCLNENGLKPVAILNTHGHPDHIAGNRALKREYPSIPLLIGELDAEMLTEHPKAGGVHLTPNWLVHSAPASLSATRIDDVVWAYKQVTQHRTNGIPTGKTYAAQIWDRHGVRITVAGKEPVVNQALEAVAQRSPWVLAGFSPELEKTWKQNRAAVIDAVEQRRRQVLGQAQGVPA